MDYQEMRAVTGGAFGVDGALELIARAEAVCLWERQRIELANESPLAAKKAEYKVLLEEEKEIKQRLVRVGRIPGESVRRRRIVINWVVAAVLVIAGFVLSALTLEPFRWGIKGVVYSIAIAFTVPFLVERVLDHFPSTMFRRVVLVLACLAGVSSVMLLASIRGKLLGEQVRQDSSPAVIDGEESEKTAQGSTFYEDTVPLLQLVMALLALSMEVGAGIAIMEAERLSEAVDGEYQTTRKELRDVQERLSFLVREIIFLQNEAALFVAQFWRDFYWGLLKGTVKDALKRFAVPVALLILACPAARSAPQKLDLVVAVDLSKSVDARRPDGKTIFQTNVAGVTQLLAKIPGGTRVTVIGITENSFSSPYVLLKANLDTDDGYFGEKLAKGRRQIVHAWDVRSANLVPYSNHTDILGALLLAGALFGERRESEHVLVIYSDMQQSTTSLNMERRRELTLKEVDQLEREGLLADLYGAKVYVCATQSPQNRIIDWMRRKTFWATYFERAGATLRVYSALQVPRALD